MGRCIISMRQMSKSIATITSSSLRAIAKTNMFVVIFGLLPKIHSAFVTSSTKFMWTNKYGIRPAAKFVLAHKNDIPHTRIYLSIPKSSQPVNVRTYPFEFKSRSYWRVSNRTHRRHIELLFIFTLIELHCDSYKPRISRSRFLMGYP